MHRAAHLANVAMATRSGSGVMDVLGLTCNPQIDVSRVYVYVFGA